MNKCSIEDCGRPEKSDALCESHLRRLVNHKKKGIDNNGKLRSEAELFKMRFDAKWDRAANGCWIWHGFTRKPFAQYAYRVGLIRKKGAYVRAPRASWEIHNGTNPGSMNVCHKCNNPLCVNPDHLYLGTHQQNMRDMAISERHGKLRLSNDDVRYIRASKEQTKVLCERFGMERSTIKQIRNGKVRKHV